MIAEATFQTEKYNEEVNREPENLSDGFTLSGQDAQVSFEFATGEMYQLDIQQEGEAVPKYKRATKSESEFIQRYLESLVSSEVVSTDGQGHGALADESAIHEGCHHH